MVAPRVHAYFSTRIGVTARVCTLYEDFSARPDPCFAPLVSTHLAAAFPRPFRPGSGRSCPFHFPCESDVVDSAVATIARRRAGGRLWVRFQYRVDDVVQPPPQVFLVACHVPSSPKSLPSHVHVTVLGTTVRSGLDFQAKISELPRRHDPTNLVGHNLRGLRVVGRQVRQDSSQFNDGGHMQRLKVLRTPLGCVTVG